VAVGLGAEWVFEPLLRRNEEVEKARGEELLRIDVRRRHFETALLQRLRKSSLACAEVKGAAARLTVDKSKRDPVAIGIGALEVEDRVLTLFHHGYSLFRS
jgi:hypothetical protein